MELELHPHRWTSRHRPDWTAAAVAGLGAGAVLMVLGFAWSASMNVDGPWRTARLVAALVLGTGVLDGAGFDLGVVAVALATHYVIGVGFGLLLGFVVAGFDYDTSHRMTLFIGGLFGVALYLLDLHGMTQFFPWFAELRGWSSLIAHLVFGMSAALLYWKLARHPQAGRGA